MSYEKVGRVLTEQEQKEMMLKLQQGEKNRPDIDKDPDYLKLEKSSRDKIKLLHPAIKNDVKCLMRDLRKSGITAEIDTILRTVEE